MTGLPPALLWTVFGVACGVALVSLLRSLRLSQLAAELDRSRQQQLVLEHALRQSQEAHREGEARLRDAEAERARLPAELQKATTQLVEKGAEVSGLLTRITGLRGELEGAHSMQEELNCRIADAESERNVALSRIDDLVRQAAASGAVLNDLTNRLNLLDERIHLLRPMAEESIQLRDKLDASERRVMELERRLGEDTVESPGADVAAEAVPESGATALPIDTFEMARLRKRVAELEPMEVLIREREQIIEALRAELEQKSVDGTSSGANERRMLTGAPPALGSQAYLGGRPAVYSVAPLKPLQEEVETSRGALDGRGLPRSESRGTSGGLAVFRKANAGRAANERDELTRIPGINAATERRLNAAGVFTFRQMAAWRDADVVTFGSLLGESGDGIRRDEWIASARMEHLRKYGERLTGS